MSTFVVWIERDMARIFKIEVGALQSKILHRHEIRHHTSRDPENHKNCDRFFGQIAERLRDADEILLVGPGLAKEHFRSYLRSHHMRDLADVIVGTRDAHPMSDAKILALSREFFRAYDVYEQVVS